ncbi:type I-F CRISPR-associated protein Csy2 [Catenovulum maritimum]|uniref:Uncharacterized protein n=1 Tax=Catenovulum maritimum TaxID=1513271 RepID=A0A0J8GVD7_9ALTE|nr:type I-F CRISPR-associated protein Csy2 [Catenovulum maritimum]KMT66750.1 hypothetical protein XM47_01090 [Catenovulum maritimum]
MNSFDEIAKIKDIQDRNRAFKRAFSAVTPFVDITNSPDLACCALINLTERLDLVDNVLDKEQALAKLSNDKFIKRSLNTFKYRHSHNLKFPDYRAHGTLRLKPLKYQFSQEPYQNRQGYAQTASDVNASIFLCAEFLIQGHLTCIGKALIDRNTIIENQLLELGLSQCNLDLMKNELDGITNNQTIDDLEANFFPQLRFPNGQNQYISLTPVISHFIQSQVHKYCISNYKSSMNYSMERSANVGSLAASTGGKVKLFKSLPSKLNFKHTNKTTKWNRFEFNEIMHSYRNLNDGLVTPNTRVQLNKKMMESLTVNLTQWLKTKCRRLDNEPTTHELVRLFNLDLSYHNKLSQYAYNPYFTKLFTRAFNNTANLSSNIGKTSQNNSKNQNFLLLPNLQINDANALNSGYAVGFPSLTGISGFIHKLQLNINNLHNLKVQLSDFAICIHKYCLANRSYTKELELTSNNKLVSPGLVDSVECDLSISVVIKMNNSENLPSDILINSLPTHFCGGSVHINLDDLSLLQQINNFEKIVEAIPDKNGQWLSPYQIEKTTIEDLLNAANFSRNLILINSGYLFLEVPTNKLGVIDNLKHAFAENVLSIANLTSFNYGTNYSRLFWSLHVSEYEINLLHKLENMHHETT